MSAPLVPGGSGLAEVLLETRELVFGGPSPFGFTPCLLGFRGSQTGSPLGIQP